ncbi:MAG TPA: DegT/DnrJ/EryC1/StrS aminotransferase family protein [Acidobacteriota bacterium]|jgi:dTDP-4-amino-4,6-dideoxygalactose transaminase
MLPFSRPDIGDEEIAEVVRCLRSGWITTGPLTARFETEFAKSVRAGYACALSSCTAALHTTLLAIGAGPGDEVILPPLTWPAAANMVIACGATPVFADIDPMSWNIDPAAIARALSARTKVVVPVHFAGLPCDLHRIRSVLLDAGRQDIRIIEDAAHAAGAFYREQPIGATSANGTVAGCFSFHPIKNMTTGEGGMVTTDDGDLAGQIKLLRFHGIQRDAWKAYSGMEKTDASYDVVLPGFKYNMTDIQAALGIHQLAKLERFNGRRKQIADVYREKFSDLEQLTLQGGAAYPHCRAWHLFAVLPPQRAPFMEKMAALGVATGVHFQAVHLHAYYRHRFGYARGDYPAAEEICSRIVSLPLYPSMTDQEVEDVVLAVRKALRDD